MKKKKIDTIQEQIQKIIKDNKKEKVNKQDEDLQYVDFNKSIENMLTAQQEDKKQCNNILSFN